MHAVDSSKKVVVGEGVVVETGSAGTAGVDSKVAGSKLRKLIEENVALRKFMFQSSKFTLCCSCYILRRRLQSVNSVVSRRSGVCC